MMDFGFYNLDCMEGMKEFPDNYFDLAIVDPVYGDVTGGGYTTAKWDKTSHHIGTGLANQKAYHRGIWNQEKTPPEYFKELFRVSKNQVIWGGGTSLLKVFLVARDGLYGISSILKDYHFRIANLLSRHSMLVYEYSVTCGMGCYKGT